MKMYQCVLILLFWTSLCSTKESVMYAGIIFRHGDRTPVDPYPTDPWRNESLWPVKFGELTNIGKRQHYAFGQWLRERYSHLLSKKFDPKEIYVRSTDVDRTLMSAQVNLAGIYPPVGDSIWNQYLMWQPIPIHTKPEQDDEVLAMKKKCPTYDKEMETYIHSNAYKDKLKECQQLMDYLTAYTGRKIKSFEDINSIYNILVIETLYNFTLPSWTRTVFPHRMREPACYSFTTSAALPKLARLRAGPLLKDIMSYVVKAMTPKTEEPLKVSIYSGHDLTIGTMLTALGLFDGNCPVYTSAILFELIFESMSSSYYIKISYRNTTENVEPVILDIPHCGKLCPVERFKNLYRNLLSVNFDVECKNQYVAVFGVSFFVGIVLLVAIYVGHRVSLLKVSGLNGSLFNYSNLPITSLNTDKIIIM